MSHMAPTVFPAPISRGDDGQMNPAIDNHYLTHLMISLAHAETVVPPMLSADTLREIADALDAAVDSVAVNEPVMMHGTLACDWWVIEAEVKGQPTRPFGIVLRAMNNQNDVMLVPLAVPLPEYTTEQFRDRVRALIQEWGALNGVSIHQVSAQE